MASTGFEPATPGLKGLAEWQKFLRLNKNIFRKTPNFQLQLAIKGEVYSDFLNESKRTHYSLNNFSISAPQIKLMGKLKTKSHKKSL